MGRYRHWLMNFTLAAVIALGAGLAGTAKTVEGARASTGLTIGTPFWVAVGAVGVVRSLRRTLTVTTVGIERRGLVWSWALPWTAITGTVVRDRRFGSEVIIKNGDRNFFAVVRDRDRTLDQNVRYRPVVRPANRVHGWGPQTQRQRRTVVLVVLLTLTAAAMLVLGQAVGDRERYAGRAERDVEVLADVVEWRLHDVSGDDDEDHPRTDISVRFLTTTGREVTTDIGRRGAFTERERVPVVYDPMNPADADFADGPNRNGQQSSAALRLLLGAIAAAVGTVALLAAVAYDLVVEFEVPPPDTRSRW